MTDDDTPLLLPERLARAMPGVTEEDVVSARVRPQPCDPVWGLFYRTWMIVTPIPTGQGKGK